LIKKLHNFEIEKTAYTRAMTSMKLKHYFQAQHIKVLYAQPLEEVFGNKDVLGRIGRWAAELNEYIVNFKHLLAMSSPHTLHCRLDTNCI